MAGQTSRGWDSHTYLNWYDNGQVRVNVHGSVHRNNIVIYIQEDATLTQFILSGNCSTCFEWYHHPPSGAQTTVSTAYGICHTAVVICRYRGRVVTGVECAVGGVRQLHQLQLYYIYIYI